MKLTLREKKLVGAALITALLLVLVEWVSGRPGTEPTSPREKLALARKQLRHNREVLAVSAQLEAQIASLQARQQQAESWLLAGREVPQAGAEFQEWLARRAGEHQLEISRSDFLAPGSLAGYTTVPVRLELTGRITQVVAFVSSVLEAERLLGIQDLDIAQRGIGQEKQVRCVLVVVGLMRRTSGGG